MRNIVNQIVFLSGLVILTLLAGCGSSGSGTASSGPTVLTSKPGSLKLTKMEGMGKSIAPIVEKEISSSATAAFDLGTIKASQEFYFLLSNSGDFAVTGVTINSDNANFIVSPGMIGEVAPQSESFIMPIIKITVNHGVALNGVGYTDSLLSMGSNTCTLTITGTTTDSSNKVIELSYNVQLNVYAEVMNIDLYDDISLIDLFKPAVRATGVLGNYMSGYKCTNNPILKNTGNVVIHVTNNSLRWEDNFPLLEQFDLAPNETKTLNYPSINSSGSKSIVLKLAGNNTITDYRKLQLGADGTVSILLQSW